MATVFHAAHSAPDAHAGYKVLARAAFAAGAPPPGPPALVPTPPPLPLLGVAAATIAFQAAPTMASMIFTGAPATVAANAPSAPPLPLLPSMFSSALANAVLLPDATAAVSLARSAAPPTTSLTRPVMAVIGFGIPPSAYPG